MHFPMELILLVVVAILPPLTIAAPAYFAVNCYDDRTKKPSSQLWYYNDFKGFPSKTENYDPNIAITITDGSYVTWNRPQGVPLAVIKGSAMRSTTFFKVSDPSYPEEEGWVAGTSYDYHGYPMIKWVGAGKDKVLTSLDVKGYGCSAVYFGVDVPLSLEDQQKMANSKRIVLSFDMDSNI
ncbi:hypothetical protein HDV05_005313 [Chytridiales sp. JEL 0842]|nr:hypothetical protein HDV05_005313 [Chytridiales sp. JEL 0842]